MESAQHFNKWSGTYEQSIVKGKDRYPFAGYYDLLATIAAEIPSNSRVLDLGIGTGALAEVIEKKGGTVTGIDFSEEMLAKAKERAPKAQLIQADLSLGLPAMVKTNGFDCIVSTYALHHLNIPQKVQLLTQAAALLSPRGEVLIGDIAFATEADMEEQRQKAGKSWDTEEEAGYWIWEAMEEHLRPHFTCSFEAISFCAGLIRLSPLNF